MPGSIRTVRRILLFDTIIDGHHADYLCHLISYWLHNRPAGELLVAAQASFEPTFQALVAQAPAGAAIRFIPFSQAEIQATHQPAALRRSFVEWELQLKYSQQYKATHVLLMYFDIFQLGLWLGKKSPCPVSGIYFRPDFHYPGTTTLKGRLNTLRKKATLRGLLKQPTLANLFCLDHTAVDWLRGRNTHANIIPLPDPVKTYRITPAELTALRQQLQPDPTRKLFLLFGHLDERKGIEPILEALHRLAAPYQQQIGFLLVGAIRPDYQAAIEQKIAAVHPNVQIIGVFREIKGRDIQAYFELTDYVFTLYQHHIGMASVIIRAAISGKPLISSDYGYMGHLVKSQQLGVVTDSGAPAAIAHTLEQVLTDGIHFSSTNLQMLANQNSDTAFAQTIFDRL